MTDWVTNQAVVYQSTSCTNAKPFVNRSKQHICIYKRSFDDMPYIILTDTFSFRFKNLEYSEPSTLPREVV